LAKRLGRNADEIPLDELAKHLDGKTLGAFSGIAAKSIRGSVGRSAREGLLQQAKKLFSLGDDLDILYNQPKNQFNRRINKIQLTCGPMDQFPRGTFFEELQHAIDDVPHDGIGRRNPTHFPADGTLENALLHKEVFKRMYDNPLFNITADEFESLIRRVDQQIDTLRGSR
jgi:hypothetical protein